eukprot:scaffold626_cov337-Pavlova_lutheri.AAC.55
MDPPNLYMRGSILCNQSLDLRAVTTIGLDMDYTPAKYQSDTCETLAHHETCESQWDARDI